MLASLPTANRGKSMRSRFCYSSEMLRDIAHLWRPSSDKAELLVVVQSVSVRHSTRLQASRMWSTAISSLARRSLERQRGRSRSEVVYGAWYTKEKRKLPAVMVIDIAHEKERHRSLVAVRGSNGPIRPTVGHLSTCFQPRKPFSLTSISKSLL